MPWICPDCSSSNSDEFVKCTCGRPFDRSYCLVSGPGEQGFKSAANSKFCPHCSNKVPSEDEFCSFCGKSTAVLSKKDKKEIQKAAKWILAISILFIVFGTIYGFMQVSVAEKAKNNIAQYEDSHIWETPVNGKHYTVAELRTLIEQEVVSVFLTNYFLAAVMFGLYLWARRSPFPAMISALCVYLAVIVLNGIIDPKTIVQGIIIKIIFISALIAGIKSSLAARSVSAT